MSAEARREYEIAAEHVARGREHAAVAHYERALELGLDDATRPGAMLGLASALRDAGRLDDSVQLLRQAVADYPDDEALKVFLSLSLHAAGRTGEALVLAISVAMLHTDVAAHGRQLTRYTDDIANQASCFKHTCYQVSDIERSLAFYDALGFRERRRYRISDRETQVMLGLDGDGELLGLRFVAGDAALEIGTAYRHIAVSIASMPATFTALEPHGLDIEQEPFSKRAGGSLIAFVRDPDGYRIELISRPEARE